MKTNIGIAEKNRQGAAEILNQLLADEFVLYSKTRNYHWNVVGPRFNDLHKFFESQYEQLDEIIDDVAERVRALGVPTKATLKEYQQQARIQEYPGQYPSSEEMLTNLLEDHEAVIRQLRNDLQVAGEKYQDMGTSDFLTGLMETHEKMAWMLRSFSGK